MKIRLIAIGKTGESYLKEGVDEYIRRLSRYCDFKMEIVPDVKNRAVLAVNALKEAEATVLLSKLQPAELVVLLDESGKQFTSIGFSEQLNKWGITGNGKIAFVIGGAFGFGEALIGRADMKMSLSAMTYSHQMVRLIFLEQLYRAFTILKNEPYHHS